MRLVTCETRVPLALKALRSLLTVGRDYIVTAREAAASGVRKQVIERIGALRSREITGMYMYSPLVIFLVACP